MRHHERAEAVPAGTTLLHIGLPKTGTSALQGAAHTSREALLEHGAEYAPRSRHDRAASNAVVFDAPPAGYDESVNARWDALVRRVQESRADRVLVSSETLSGARDRHVPRIVDDLGDRVHVVVTLRPLGSVLASRWQQQVQNSAVFPFDEFLRQSLTPDGKGAFGGHSFGGRYDLARLVPRWAAAVGEQNITLVVIDPRDRDMLLHTFDRLLGVPDGTLSPDPTITNSSLPFPAVEMLRSFGSEYAASDRGRAEWVHVVRGRARKAWSRRTDLGLEPYPIRTPRWAAERANELTLPMLDHVRSSDVNVVGDLADLLVDPDDHPVSQEPPDRISVEAAGNLAHVLFDAALLFAREQHRRQPQPDLVGLGELPTRDIVAELRSRLRPGRRRR